LVTTYGHLWNTNGSGDIKPQCFSLARNRFSAAFLIGDKIRERRKRPKEEHRDANAAFLIGVLIPASYIFEQNMPDLPPDLDSAFYSYR